MKNQPQTAQKSAPAHPATPLRAKVQKAFTALGSIKISLVLFAIYAACCAAATLIEAKQGTPAAWALIYGTAGFSALHLALGANLFAALFVYKMSARWGLFLFHLSFLFMLLGAGITRFAGFEATLHLREGESSQIASTRAVYLTLANADGTSVSEEFSPSAARASAVAKLPSGERLEALRLIPHARAVYKEASAEVAADGAGTDGAGKSATDGAGKSAGKSAAQPLIELIAASEAASTQIALERGRFGVLGDVVLAHDRAVPPQMKALIFSGQNVRANFDFELIDPASYASRKIAANTEAAVQIGEIISFGEQKITLLQRYAAARKTYEASDDEELPNVLQVRLCGQSGECVGGYLREAEAAKITLAGANYAASYGHRLIELPFAMRLDKFLLERYAMSASPKSYESFISIQHGGRTERAHIFMNHVLDYGGMRFFQSSYDQDLRGSVLSINRDPGKLPTYIGYFLLGLGLFINVCERNSRFRRLARAVAKGSAAAVLVGICALLLALAPVSANAAVVDGLTGEVGAVKSAGAVAANADSVAKSGANSSAGAAKPTASGEAANSSASAAKPQASGEPAKSGAAKSDSVGKSAASSAAEEIAAAIAAAKSKLAPVTAAEHAAELDLLAASGANGRVGPFATTSAQLLEKIAKEREHAGLSATQVLLKIICEPKFFADEPLIYQPNKELAAVLKNPAKRLAFSDFFAGGEYVLKQLVAKASRRPDAERSAFERDLLKVDERVNLLYMAQQGYFLAIFAENGALLSPQQTSSPAALAYLEALADAGRDGNFALASSILRAASAEQQKSLDTRKFAFEIAFDRLDAFKRLMPVYLLLGLAALALVFAELFTARRFDRVLAALKALGVLAFALLTAAMAARAYIAGHAPWSNSYESLLYIAWALALAGLVFARRSAISLSLAALLAGCVLFVAQLSHIDPQIGNLAPVLSSIWLSIHVSVITASYGFLGLCAMLGIFVLVLFALSGRLAKSAARGGVSADADRLARIKASIRQACQISEMAMILGLSLLVMGNFLGGVWANESWGRYWGWDSKETWALISILVYAIVLHLRLWPRANSQLVFATASVFAYYSILMTYFGVNYFLTGMHSYAAGNAASVPGYVYFITSGLILLAIFAGFNHKFSEKL